MSSMHIAKGLRSAFLILSGRQFSAYRGKFSAKVAKVRFYLVCFGVFSGFWETAQGKNLIYFWKVGAGGAGCASSLACPLVAGGAGFRGPGPAGGWLWSSGRVSCPFCLLSRFALGALALNMALFRILRGFLAWFGVFVWVCIVLVLCVACVALYA